MSNVPTMYFCPLVRLVSLCLPAFMCGISRQQPPRLHPQQKVVQLHVYQNLMFNSRKATLLQAGASKYTLDELLRHACALKYSSSLLCASDISTYACLEIVKDHATDSQSMCRHLQVCLSIQMNNHTNLICLRLIRSSLLDQNSACLSIRLTDMYPEYSPVQAIWQSSLAS